MDKWMKLNKAYTRYSLLIVFGILFTILLIPTSEASAVVFSDNFTDNDITDWLVTGRGNNDAIADNGRMRLRVWRCSDVVVSKDLGFLSGDLIIDFDSETYAERFSEEIKWKFIVNGITIINEDGSSGHIRKDLNVNGNVQLQFSIHESKYCSFGDHENTYLWVDNLDLKLIPPTPPKSSSLSITKSASPYSLRQFQESTIKVLIENSGTTEVKAIEIMDSIHPSFDLIGGDFTNPKKFDSIRASESREIQYTIKSKESGAFTLDPATVTYADSEGNIQEIKSEPVSIKVAPSVPSTDGGNSKSASVNLYGEKTDVVLGENVLLKLSAINIIGNPVMHVQVIIIPPNGWSVTSSEFSKSGAGQYTTIYDLNPENGARDIEVQIMPNQIGDNFEVKGRIIYYFGDDLTTREDHTLNMPIKVRAESKDLQNLAVQPSKSPGFEIILAIVGMILALAFRRK